MLRLYIYLAINLLFSNLSFSISPENSCQLIIDAGSSGTRLYAYEKIEGKLKQVFSYRRNIGISWALEEKTCDKKTCIQKDILEVIDLLIDRFKKKIGKNCNRGVRNFNLYATAGMRIAEQKKGSSLIRNNYLLIKKRIEKKVLKKKGVFFKLKKENIILGNGSEGIMAYIARAFLQEGDEVLVVDGVMSGMKTVVTKIMSGKERVRILMDWLGQEREAEVKFTDITHMRSVREDL